MFVLKMKFWVPMVQEIFNFSTQNISQNSGVSFQNDAKVLFSNSTKYDHVQAREI